jgi:acyl carrier protein
VSLKRREVPQVVAAIRRRPPQDLDSFIRDCGLQPSDHLRRIADAIRESLAHGATFGGDQLRAEDSNPGTLEALPGWDSPDFVEWTMVFEEYLGEPVPDDAFSDIGAAFTVSDLVQSAQRRQSGEGIRRTEGALADDTEWDAIMEEIQQARRRERRPQTEESQ